MAEVKSNGKLYIYGNAIANTIDYYTDEDNSGSKWSYWTAFGIDNNNIDTAKNQMIDLKVKRNHYKGAQMHQVLITIPRDEIRGMMTKPDNAAEKILVDNTGKYFLDAGFQNLCFVYRWKEMIFIRVIVNSTPIKKGKPLDDIGPLVYRLEHLMNAFIGKN